LKQDVSVDFFSLSYNDLLIFAEAYRKYTTKDYGLENGLTKCTFDGMKCMIFVKNLQSDKSLKYL